MLLEAINQSKIMMSIKNYNYKNVIRQTHIYGAILIKSNNNFNEYILINNYLLAIWENMFFSSKL